MKFRVMTTDDRERRDRILAEIKAMPPQPPPSRRDVRIAEKRSGVVRELRHLTRDADEAGLTDADLLEYERLMRRINRLELRLQPKKRRLLALADSIRFGREKPNG